METELLDDELEADMHYHGLEQSFDNTIPDWDNKALAQFQVIRRNGQLTEFNANKISEAITKTFLAVEHSQTPSSRIKQITQQLAKQVIVGVSRRLKDSGKVHIEDIQDQVELALMRAGEHQEARAYVLYREQHAVKRAEQNAKTVVNMVDDEGTSQPLDEQRLRHVIVEACSGLADVDSEVIIHDSLKNLFDGISERDLNNVLVMTVRALIEKEPNYTYVASRLLLDRLRTETLAHIGHTQHHLTAEKMGQYYPTYFQKYLEHGIKYELLSPELMNFDIERLGQALHPERDLNFTYLGLQTLYDRYFLHWQDTRFELPQAFFMRVAMGLSIKEDDREARAIEFYKLLSTFSLMSSTPTLFNSGTLRPQLSSCFISTVPDDLDGIFSAIKDNALMQKWAGGIGNDWTSVRGMGSIIKGTNGRSQGVVPFLKVANDTLVSVNQ
ncbi:MAG: ATP cone domain-containing protein, partial [Thiotrichaceae bacterium]|nr:ATP cone domain-containing protein [Thiotrichaceae bacterium]